ncbi:poly-gamma-glutamate hydrolase family protein [Streptomyces sp. WMMC940]|uniref:poly-gamma-glutamate hydrolase family protein n=1 Tax=Streptomyces sp. WMMC940 TaxID=3015153 RepID=UPI0022B67436|nr:poly-gamma-glutamate hydrolase family protein [Streptomyces sp. WMMC940]MCZ7456310.1 poly-gamma-glutamate hydrolase family protein [Streptomyces sp. WMMC940]
MTYANRRTVLAGLAGAALSATVLDTLTASPAHAADQYTSNTDLYTKLAGQEGSVFARRYRRHEMVDVSDGQRHPFNRTTIMALHGGGIEGGTSELCLAIAGYHPATLAAAPAGGPAYDYWMFEGIAPSGNGDLHVTSTHNDDRVALSMAAGSLNVLSLHGCRKEQAGTPAGEPEAVVVGGLNTTFKTYLHEEFQAAGFRTIDGSTVPALAGENPENICNKTLLRQGAQLEMTTELRQGLFDAGHFSRLERPTHTNERFTVFVGAARRAIARLEARSEQAVL